MDPTASNGLPLGDIDIAVWNELPEWLRAELAPGERDGAGEQPFHDDEFPPVVASLVGKATVAAAAEAAPTGATQAVLCACRVPARYLTVRKETRNKGRKFYSCAARRCKFFQWAREGDDGPWIARRLKFADGITWKRHAPSQGWIVVSALHGFSPLDVKQGSVGDCWFLSAIAVLAERPDLIDRIVLTREPQPAGKYAFSLFLDGQWRRVQVDDSLPVKGDRVAFAKPSRHQLWAPLLEKAYAKAHGSYFAISGGEIAEAMHELTAFPTETISLSAADFDSDTTWVRLMSFAASRFPMACGTASGGSGLVGMHAYSILEVRELSGHMPSVQLKMDQFVGTSCKVSESPALEQITEHGTLRVLRLRNPWGQREWKGAWGQDSELWSRALMKRLDRGQKNDGTFWMSYHDFLLRFEMIDVCKAHRGWHTSVHPNVQIGDSLLLQAESDVWTYISCVQPSTRGRRDRRLSHVNLLVASRTDGRYWPCGSILGARRATAHCEVHLARTTNRPLEDDGYLIWPVTFDKQSRAATLSVIVLSSKPVTIRRVDVPNYASVLGSCLMKAFATHRVSARLESGAVEVSVIETADMTLVLARNRSRDEEQLVQLGIKTGGEVFSPAPDLEGSGAAVPPAAARVVAAVVNSGLDIANGSHLAIHDFSCTPASIAHGGSGGQAAEEPPLFCAVPNSDTL